METLVGLALLQGGGYTQASAFWQGGETEDFAFQQDEGKTQGFAFSHGGIPRGFACSQGGGPQGFLYMFARRETTRLCISARWGHTGRLHFGRGEDTQGFAWEVHDTQAREQRGLSVPR